MPWSDDLDDEPVLHPLPPLLLREDVEQERALAALLGKHGPYQRFQFPARELGYGTSAPDNGTAFFGEGDSLPDPEVIDKLAAWTTQQSARVQAAVIEYLEDPKDQSLEHVLQLIDRAVPEDTEPIARPNFAQLVLRSLPATKDQLYQLAYREHLAKRPEATVRQVVRRLSAQGKLRQEGEVYVRA